MGIRSLCCHAMALCLLAGFGTAQKRFELQDLVKLADVCFHGRVVEMQNEEAPDKGMAFTHVTFALDRVLVNRTGKDLGAQLVLTFAGGNLGERIVRVTHVPQFALGQEVLAFAQHDGRRFSSPVLGGEQGLLRILRDDKNGDAYPLLVGGRGIAGVVKGSFDPADRVASVEDGVVRWREPEVRPGSVHEAPPTPVAGTGAVGASLRRPQPKRPERLADLAAVCRGIESLAALPRPADRRQGGR